MPGRHLAIAAILLAPACAPETPESGANWSPSLPLAMEAAADSNMKVFVFFSATWCGLCQGTKEDALADPDVTNALQACIPVNVDVDASSHIAEKYGIAGVPAMLLLTPKGNVLRRAIGVMDPKQLLEFLEPGAGAVEVAPPPA